MKKTGTQRRMSFGMNGISLDFYKPFICHLCSRRCLYIVSYDGVPICIDCYRQLLLRKRLNRLLEGLNKILKGIKIVEEI